MRRRSALRGLVAATTVGLAGCSVGDGGDGEDPDADGGGGEDGGTDDEGTAESDLSIASPAFEDGGAIPRRYTADGEDVSPPLSVAGVSEAAAALALVVEDPDAPDPPFTHWLLWNLPAETTEIPEGQPTGAETLPGLGGARQGTNDFDALGYRGPSPPGDDPHRYRFRVSALDAALDVEAGAKRDAVVSAVEERRVAEATLAGTYAR